MTMPPDLVFRAGTNEFASDGDVESIPVMQTVGTCGYAHVGTRRKASMMGNFIFISGSLGLVLHLHPCSAQCT